MDNEEKKMEQELMSCKPESMMKLYEIVSTRRKNVNMTESELARKSGLTQAQISEFESGKYSLTSDNIDNIIEVLNLKFEENADYLWELATKCAKLLKEKGVTDSGVDSISKEEMAQLSGNDEIMLLKVFSDKTVEKFIACHAVTEHETYNYFKTLVRFKLAILYNSNK